MQQQSHCKDGRTGYYPSEILQVVDITSSNRTVVDLTTVKKSNLHAD